MLNVQDIIRFWFFDIPQSIWWKKDDDFDALIVRQFSSLHRQAAQGELSHWRKDALGCLAEVIILDQFSRNMFRGTAKAFEFDGLALALAQNAVLREMDKNLTNTQCSVLYMPFMHSESVQVHEFTFGLFSSLGIESSLNYELRHKKIIDRFGRYPHRNAVLGRESTDEEIDFLNEPGSSF